MLQPFVLGPKKIKQGKDIPHFLRSQLAHRQPNGLLVAGPDLVKVHCR